MALLGRLARQSGVYALGNAAVKAAGLAIAPLLLNPAYLSIEGFGYFALLMVTAQLAIYVVGLGLSTGLVKHLSGEDPAMDLDALPFTALLASVAAAIVAAVLLVATAGSIADLLVDSRESVTLVWLLATYVAFKVVAAVPMTVLRVRERAGAYVLATSAELVALVAFVWYFLAARGMGLTGLMAAYAGSAAIATVLMSGALLSHIPRRFDRRAIRPLLTYGVPLVLASLAGWFLNAGDRYLLKWLTDARAVAGYDWAARLAGLINMLFVQSFQLAFTVLGMKALAAGESRFYPRAMRHYVIWTGAAVLALSLFTDDGMRLLVSRFSVDPFYAEADRLVFPLALGFMGFGIYVIVNNVLLATGHTKVVGGTVLLAAALNAGLNLILIPIWGAFGAALATLVAYATLAALAARAAERLNAMGYAWGMVFQVVAVLVILVYAGHLATPLDTLPRIAIRLGLCVAYGGFVTLTGLYPASDVLKLLRRARDQGQNGPDPV